MRDLGYRRGLSSIARIARTLEGELQILNDAKPPSFARNF